MRVHFNPRASMANMMKLGLFPNYCLHPAKNAKKVKEKSRGLHSYHYNFDGLDFYAPAHYISLFYNYLYLNSLCEEENRNIADLLLAGSYDAFNNLATLSLNSQAQSCAIFVSLVKNGLVNQVRDFDSFLRLFRTTRDGKAVGRESYDHMQLLDTAGKIQLLSPVVPCVVERCAVQKWYESNCSGLTNRKNIDIFLDLSISEPIS